MEKIIVDKNNRRFNPAAVVVVNGVPYNGNVMVFPDAVAELGLHEIEIEGLPTDVSHETHYIREIDDAPYYSVAPKSPETLAADHLSSVMTNRKAAYANESDPLMYDYLQGKIDKQVWLDKVAEIKERFPK